MHMAYNIKLFIHGVPNGHDVWGNPEADANYIDAFYGRKPNITSQMLLEVMQFGGETNAYYTFFYYNDKIQDYSGRPGGYFALTLRINYYYADIRNIYNLLEAAFNKYIIGTVLEYTSGGGCRFLVTQFDQAKATFSSLEKELQHYLMQFSSNKDFMLLSGFKTNAQDNCGVINLLEAMPDTMAAYVKSKGKVSVSPLHPSSKEQQIINKMNAELNATTANAQQQISAAQQKAQQDVLAAQKDKEQGIQNVRNEYREADNTIRQLRAQNNKANNDISRLSAQVNELNVKLRDTQSYKARYEESQRKLSEKEKLIENIKNSISDFVGFSEVLGIHSGDYKGRRNEAKKGGFMSFIRKIHPFTDFFVLFVLLGIIGVAYFKGSNEKTKPHSTLIADKGGDGTSTEQKQGNHAEDKVAQATSVSEPDIPSGGDKVNKKEVADVLNLQQNIETLKMQYPEARIDVSNINEKKNDYMKVNSDKIYRLSIVKSDPQMSGQWQYKPSEFEIKDNIITPKKSGPCTINYLINGQVYLTKTINVINGDVKE